MSPPRGLRGQDAWGDGAFNAPREQGSRVYGHEGLDFLAEPGDDIVAPISGSLTRIGRAYADPDCDLASLHIEGGGQFKGTRIKLLYVAHLKLLSEGSLVEAGKPIGVSQEVAAYHMRHHPERGVMPNHVHLEMRVMVDNVYRLVDPAAHLAVVACT